MSVATTARTRQVVSFSIRDQLAGLEIGEVQEVNRAVDCRSLPHVPPAVRGVMNLRGEVVTVLDLALVLGLPPTQVTPRSRTLVVNWNDERIGLLVDRIADVVDVSYDTEERLPANLRELDERFFRGVCKLDDELLVLLNLDEVLSSEAAERTRESMHVRGAAYADTPTFQAENNPNPDADTRAAQHDTDKE